MTHNSWVNGVEYVKGLVCCPERRSLTAISDNCSQVNNQALSHFLSQSPWDHRLLLNWIQKTGVRMIGKFGALVIDECGNVKAGLKSVGVWRQYCGNLGKVENCQVGVFMAYVKRGTRLLIDFRLYLPKCWIDDPERCKAAGIPNGEQVFRTKAELAYEMIIQAVQSGIRFSHICMDGFYGNHPWLLTKLEELNLIYAADISSDCHVYPIEPVHEIPTKKGNQGGKPTRFKVFNTKSVRVDELIKNVDRWRVMRIRRSMDGFLEVRFMAIKVWRIDKEVLKPLPVWLLIRKEIDNSKIKYSLCNDITNQSWDKLVKMQSDRYWIERSFEDAIDLAGMADYQVRNWNAWHHHMALVLLTMLWITKEQRHFLENFSDITPQDMIRMIKQKIALKIKTALTVAKRILENHKNRRDSRRSKMKQKTRLKTI